MPCNVQAMKMSFITTFLFDVTVRFLRESRPRLKILDSFGAGQGDQLREMKEYKKNVTTMVFIHITDKAN